MEDYESLVQELLEIGRQIKNPSYSASGYLYKDENGRPAKDERAQEIGSQLDSMGGMQMMQSAHEEVSMELGSVAARELESIWRGIGNWM